MPAAPSSLRGLDRSKLSLKATDAEAKDKAEADAAAAAAKTIENRMGLGVDLKLSGNPGGDAEADAAAAAGIFDGSAAGRRLESLYLKDGGKPLLGDFLIKGGALTDVEMTMRHELSTAASASEARGVLLRHADRLHEPSFFHAPGLGHLTLRPPGDDWALTPGIANPGCICYLTVLVQQLHAIPTLRGPVIAAGSSAEPGSAAFELATLLASLSNRSFTCDAAPLFAALKGSTSSVFCLPPCLAASHTAIVLPLSRLARQTSICGRAERRSRRLRPSPPGTWRRASGALGSVGL